MILNENIDIRNSFFAANQDERNPIINKNRSRIRNLKFCFNYLKVNLRFFNPTDRSLLFIQTRMTVIILFKCIIADVLIKNYSILKSKSAERRGYDGK